jgi:hypothetical protein
LRSRACSAVAGSWLGGGVGGDWWRPRAAGTLGALELIASFNRSRRLLEARQNELDRINQRAPVLVLRSSRYGEGQLENILGNSFGRRRRPRGTFARRKLPTDQRPFEWGEEQKGSKHEIIQYQKL